MLIFFVVGVLLLLALLYGLDRMLLGSADRSVGRSARRGGGAAVVLAVLALSPAGADA